MCRNRTDGQVGSAYKGRLYSVESWHYMGKGTTEEQIQHELKTNGPIAAGMCANKVWSAYNQTKGVLTAAQGETCTHIDHDVNYVGWGTDNTTGLDYWLVRSTAYIFYIMISD